MGNRRQKHEQREMRFETVRWGGARQGAGRKPLPKSKRRIAHRSREAIGLQQPVHVTWRVRDDVWNLRSRRSFRPMLRAFAAVSDRWGVRLTHFVVLGNHLHVIVEADRAGALARAMKALAIRLAKGLNRLMGRKGALFTDRYHTHVLRSPTEVLHAIRYVLGNANVHAARQGRPTSLRADAYAAGYGVNDGSDASWRALADDGPPIAPPRSWLMRVGWQVAAARTARPA